MKSRSSKKTTSRRGSCGSIAVNDGRRFRGLRGYFDFRYTNCAGWNPSTKNEGVLHEKAHWMMDLKVSQRRLRMQKRIHDPDSHLKDLTFRQI
jgi:hypothetical protein